MISPLQERLLPISPPPHLLEVKSLVTLKPLVLPREMHAIACVYAHFSSTWNLAHGLPGQSTPLLFSSFRDKHCSGRYLRVPVLVPYTNPQYFVSAYIIALYEALL